MLALYFTRIYGNTQNKNLCKTYVNHLVFNYLISTDSIFFEFFSMNVIAKSYPYSLVYQYCLYSAATALENIFDNTKEIFDKDQLNAYYLISLFFVLVFWTIQFVFIIYFNIFSSFELNIQIMITMNELWISTLFDNQWKKKIIQFTYFNEEII